MGHRNQGMDTTKIELDNIKKAHTKLPIYFIKDMGVPFKLNPY